MVTNLLIEGRREDAIAVYRQATLDGCLFYDFLEAFLPMVAELLVKKKAVA